MNKIPLDKLIICPGCHTLHRKIRLKDAETAYCDVCEKALYTDHKNLLEKGLAIALATLITFIMASSFAIVRIEINGIWHDLTLPFVFVTLFKEHFWVVGLIVSFLIFFVPLLYIVIYTFVMLLFRLRRGYETTRKLLVLLSQLRAWNMVEIFLISILVALVKLIGYAQIVIGVSFWALAAFILLDIYLTRQLRIADLWDLREEIYHAQR
ncbi:MAG TPA: paraquat-inducible protein A [Campylobacteraceae bacterium]|jgi:paraquat-inducible protein A|nr:paraquat-inducible protein A [Campylobacteraceae bacterium]